MHDTSVVEFRMLQSSNSVLSASSNFGGPSLNALAGFTSVIMSLEVRELKELVLVREVQLRRIPVC